MTGNATPLPSQSEAFHEITMRFLAEPSTVNFGGKVHGGSVMKWIDEAGYACAMKWAGRYCVTASVSGISFLRPIHVGHLIEVRARLAMTGRTSMHIMVDVSAGAITAAQLLPTTKCLIVFVAIDETGKPVDINHWEPRSPEALALLQYAQSVKHARDQTKSLE